jgi:hypothetical protein
MLTTASSSFSILGTPQEKEKRKLDDVDPAEADLMAIVQKPFNQSIFGEKSGPPAWKQLPTWYQISTSDHMIPPDVQRCLQNE